MAANTLFDEVLESLVAEGGKVEKRHLNVVLERDVRGRELSLSLKISDSKRPLFLLVFECGPGEYAELRQKQRLKIEFNSFPVKLAGLLKECRAESHREPRLEVWVEEVDDGVTKQFSILEPNEFKTLRHLSLHVKEAEPVDVDLHVKGIVDRLTREAAEAGNIADQEKRKRAESADEIRKLQNELVESKRASSEEVARLQDKIEKLENSQHETEELRKHVQGSQKQLSEALKTLEKERTESEKLSSEAKTSRQRELAATEKLQFLERASKDGDKMASHIGALLESSAAERARLESANAELTSKLVKCEEQLKFAESAKVATSFQVEKLEVALAEKEALVASMSSLREKYKVLQKQFDEREALAEQSTELTNRLQEADHLISSQKKTILNNHEVIKWLNQQLNALAVQSNSKSNPQPADTPNQPD
ncbi:hypothetical protein NDN08_005427 [Rhodosorus marinus]|uniref:Spindle assembly abnormal protein 6 N-terminal domain-containing protein n=1 Tax=Rhodosorus marinus TaxID=101924 RepID=A0AAV8V4I0_9RHOD|nr:hypothetical protein NDN08_005427 [Rhodosorus marinus]